MYGASSVIEVCSSSDCSDAVLIVRPNRSLKIRTVSRRPIRAAVNVAAAAATPGPNAPAGTPPGSPANVPLPQPHLTRIRRCSLTSTRTMISDT